MLEQYRCYFLDAADHIQAATDIEAEALSEAIDRGLAMLRERPQSRSIEMWQGAQKVYPA